MPAQFLLRGFGKQLEQGRLVTLQESCPIARYFFRGIGGAHANAGVRVPEASEQSAELFRLQLDQSDDFVRPPDRPAIASDEHCAYCFFGSRRYSLSIYRWSSRKPTRASAAGRGPAPQVVKWKPDAQHARRTGPQPECTFAMAAVLGGLAANGTFMLIGATPSLTVSPLQLLSGRQSVKGWYSGTSIDSQDTLAFSVLSGVRSRNEIFPLERAAEGYERMMSGKARFRGRSQH